MRKIISVILPAALLLTALAAAPASAAEQAADNPFRFSVLSDGTAQITHCNIREGNVTVPAEIDGRAVTEIGEMAFSFSALTGVDLPDSLRAVGRQAFLNCRSLQSIRFPDSLESVDYRAFDNTAWYTIQPDGVVYAGKVAYGCKGACPAKIELAEGTVGVASWAFRDCSALAEIAVPDSVRYIGAYAFNGTAWLDSQPDGIVYAGRVAYKMKGVCPSQAVIREGTVSIAENAFYGCADALQSVVIPDTVTAIGRGAFSQCCSLTDVVIPDSVTAIGENAFDRCSSLQTITVPASVAYIQKNAFDGCDNVTILGKQNSYAQDFAAKQHILFKMIDADESMVGDVSGDGNVDITDATIVQQFAAEVVVPTAAQKTAADTNHDGAVDITDATLIQMYAAEIIHSF